MAADPTAGFPSHDLADLTFVEIESYLGARDLILVPIASTEQHGPHLPLSTDTITATEIASRVAEQAGVLRTPTVWTGYSPQHMHEPGRGRGTITLRSSTFLALIEDVGRSLIHHGFNRLVFINGHGSNVKVLDPVLRELRYSTGALVALVKPYAERYMGLVDDLMENPPEETPGWHASELETSQDLASRPDLVHMDRAADTRAHIPEFLPEAFRKQDGAPDVEFEGYTYFTFPMDQHEFVESGVIGNPLRASAEKGEEALRRYSDHVARGVTELLSVPVDVHAREFVNRAL